MILMVVDFGSLQADSWPMSVGLACSDDSTVNIVINTVNGKKEPFYFLSSF